MLARTRLAHVGKTAACAQSGLVRVRPLSQSRLQCRSQPSQTQFSRRLSNSQTTRVQENSKQPEAQAGGKPLGEPLPQPLSIDRLQLGRLIRATPTSDGEYVNLGFEHRRWTKIPQLVLRDACPCAQCVSESSGQKRFATCDIDATPQLESSEILEDGSLELVWAHDFMSGGPHTSNYPLHFLQSWIQNKALPGLTRPQRYLWDRAAFEENLEARMIGYDAWMEGGEPFAKSLLDLATWGLIIVKNVPESKDAVKEVANKIGNLQSTFYGETWDVISKPSAENVAYTNEFLCLHQDLMYHRDIPFIQVLHCLKNDCPGGDSLFSDGFRAAAELKKRSPSAHDVLTRQTVPFQYSRNGHYYEVPRLTIQAPRGDVTRALPAAVHWSPPFQSPFSTVVPSQRLSKWHKAAKVFKDSLEAPENMLQYRLQPGDCVLFNNWRILHGRTKFDTSSGFRHLHGAYLTKQVFESALRRAFERGYFPQVPVGELALKAEQAQVNTLYGIPRKISS
ncbi:hypothetical protein N0V82_010051 [Gnomoniopsis sp. IMI 355080]|nr:hypothetical protein N0V82_010051 [Gnomoniopsis sp. IMI 355080]